MALLRVVLQALFVAAVFAAGSAAAVLAVAAHGGRTSSRLDLLTHFAPVYLVVGLIVLGVAAVQHGPIAKAALAVVGGVATLAAVALMLPEFLRPMSPVAPADAPRQVKLIQFNTWGRNIEVDRTAAWIAAQEPDVVVIEEATPQIRAAMLAAGRWHVDCPADCPVLVFSRVKPVSSDFRQPAEDGAWLALGQATLRAPGGGTYTVIGCHYTWPTMPRLQRAQGRRLDHAIDRADRERVIVVGDFNSTPWSFARRAEDRRLGLERRTRALATWPAGEFSRLRIRFPVPFLAIDHVYAGKAWRTVSVKRGPRLGSDHYPVVVRLALASAPPRSRPSPR